MLDEGDDRASQAETFSAALGRLKQEASKGSAQPIRQSRKLDLRNVEVEAVVFQPRNLEGGLVASEALIEDLCDGIIQAPSNLISDPVDVWWSGNGSSRWMGITG